MTTDTGTEAAPFLDLVAAYLGKRRWFAGKGRHFRVTHLHGLPWIESAQAPEVETRTRIEVVTVEFDDGSTDTYQFPIAYRNEVDPAHDEITPLANSTASETQQCSAQGIMFRIGLNSPIPAEARDEMGAGKSLRVMAQALSCHSQPAEQIEGF